MSDYGESDEVVPVLLTQVKQEPEDDFIVETVYAEGESSFSEVDNSFGEVDNSFDESDTFSMLSHTFNVHEPDYIITTQVDDDEEEEEFYYIEQPINKNVSRKRKRNRKDSRSKRRRRCGICGPCQIKQNCGECIQCVRRSVLKQSCIYRKCVYLRKPKKSASVEKPDHLNENAYQYLYPVNDDVLMPDDTAMLERPQVLLSPEDRTSEHQPLSPTSPLMEPVSPGPLSEQMDQQELVEDQPDQQLPEDEQLPQDEQLPEDEQLPQDEQQPEDEQEEQLQPDSTEEATEESGETGACSQEFFQHMILESDGEEDNLENNPRASGHKTEETERRVPSPEGLGPKHIQHELLRQKILERWRSSTDILHVHEANLNSVVPEHRLPPTAEQMPSENLVSSISSAGYRTPITSLERQFSGEDRDHRLPSRPILQQMAPTSSHLAQRVSINSNSGQRFPSDANLEQSFPTNANLESRFLPNGTPEQRFPFGAKAEGTFPLEGNMTFRYPAESSGRVPPPGMNFNRDQLSPRGSLVHWYPWQANMDQRFPSGSNLGHRFPPDPHLFRRFPTAAPFEHHSRTPFDPRLPTSESAKQKPSPGSSPDGAFPERGPLRTTDIVQEANSEVIPPDKANLGKRVSPETNNEHGHGYQPKSDLKSGTPDGENMGLKFPRSNTESRFQHRPNMEQCVPPGPNFEQGFVSGASFRHEHYGLNSDQRLSPRLNQNIHHMDRSKRDLYDRWHRQRTSHQEVMAYSRQQPEDPSESRFQNDRKSRKRKLQGTKDREWDRENHPFARMSGGDSMFRSGLPYYPMPPGFQQSFRMPSPGNNPHVPNPDHRNYNPRLSCPPYHPVVPRPESPRAASVVNEPCQPKFDHRNLSPGMSRPPYHSAVPSPEFPQTASVVSEPYPPKFDHRNVNPRMSRPPYHSAVPRPESPRAASVVSEPYPPKLDHRNASPGMSHPLYHFAVPRPESPQAASTVSQPYPPKFDHRNVSPGMSHPPYNSVARSPEFPRTASVVSEPYPTKFDHINVSPGMSRPPPYPSAAPRPESPRAASTLSEPYPSKFDSFRMRHPVNAPRMYSPWLPHGIPFNNQFASYCPPGPMGYPNFQFRPGMMPPHMMPPYFPRFPHPPPSQYMPNNQNNCSDQESGHRPGQPTHHPYYPVPPKPPNTSSRDLSANELTNEKAHQNSQLRRYLDDVYMHSSGPCRQPPRSSSVPGGIEGKSRSRLDLSDYEHEMISIDDFHVSAYIRADGTNSVEIEIDEASLLGSRSHSPANSDLTSVSRSGKCHVESAHSLIKTSAVTKNKLERRYEEIVFQGENIVIGLKSAVEGSVVMKQDLGEEGILQMEIPGHKFTVENVLLETEIVALSSNKEELLKFVKCVHKEVVDTGKKQRTSVIGD